MKPFIDGTNVVKIADQVLIEAEHLRHPLPGLKTEAVAGRLEGLAIALSIIAGGDEDANQTAEPNPD